MNLTSLGNSLALEVFYYIIENGIPNKIRRV